MTIYYDRVNQLANMQVASHARILGNAIAHEMGHLMLGSTPYWPSGIMREPWTQDELDLLAKGALQFSSEQAMLMRSELMRRVRGSSVENNKP